MNLLEAMRIYVAVVEHGGLPGAASELKLGAAHVSDRIDGLERYLGCRLLLRCADDGVAFHQCCVRTLSAVDDAMADAGIRPPDAHVAEARRAAPHALHAARR